MNSQQRDELPDWIYDVDTSRGLGRRLTELVPENHIFFTDRLRLAVEDSLTRTVDLQGASASPERLDRLDPNHLKELTDAISTRFKPQDLELLVRDYFDLSLDDISSPSASPLQRARDLILYAERRGRLPQLVDSLADSHRSDERLESLSVKRKRR